MKKHLVPHEGFAVAVDSLALVAGPDGTIEFKVPASNGDRYLTRAQVLITALAARCNDEQWVEEQIDFLAEVARRLDAQEAATKKLH